MPDASKIDLWRLALNDPDPALGNLSGLLSQDEAERARRFRFQRDRDKFVRVRASLRIILSGYMGIGPAQIEFGYRTAGKPYLPDGVGADGLHFNVSHSGEMALVAVGFGREVGVDIEHVRQIVDLHDIAKRFFSHREVAELFSLPADQQTIAFFNCWTRKEAYVKAIGAGLGFPLDAFDVSLRPEEPAALIEVRDDPAERKHWTLQDVSPKNGYTAALVAEGSNWEPRLRRLEW